MSKHNVLLKLIGDIDKILDTPEHWCRRAFAKNASGWTVKVESPDAVEFCLTGAVERACWVSGNMQYEPTLKALFEKECWPVGVAVVNDFGGTDFAEIKRIINTVRNKVVQNYAAEELPLAVS